VIFNENAYYNPGFTGNTAATSLTSTLAPIYATTGVPIFGQDPSAPPVADPSASLGSFELYASLGWIPSVTNAQVNDAIFTTGPFMFMATASNSTVTGYPNFVNFLSGGTAPNATLIGGNTGDYFIGGPGQNTITGGSGNDTIYAHPANAASKGTLLIDLASSIPGTGSTPSVAIYVNGNRVVPPTPITALSGPSGTTPQRLQVSLPGSISSVELAVTSNGGSAVYVADMIYNGVWINLGLGTYANGHPPPFPMSAGGFITFPGSAFAVVPQLLSNTSDVIDGGGGTNTVIYRGPSSNYTVTKQSNGSYLVTSAATAEGPDTLTNIQILQFSDIQMNLP
jgi:Ca2+-binding RTX toxin-like protein